MRRPRIWLALGVWYCGWPHPVARVPVTVLFGSGSTPAAAYADWVRSKWRTGRLSVSLRRQAKASRPGPIIVTSNPEPVSWFERAWHRFKGQ